MSVEPRAPSRDKLFGIVPNLRAKVQKEPNRQSESRGDGYKKHRGRNRAEQETGLPETELKLRKGWSGKVTERSEEAAMIKRQQRKHGNQGGDLLEHPGSPCRWRG